MHAAIVTGVSRGLGEALAAVLLDRGFTVLGVGRSASARLDGRGYRHVTCDFADTARVATSVEAALQTLAADKPTAVTLINNAAVATPTGLVGRLDAAEIESTLVINVVAPLVMTDLFCRWFTDDAVERRIINISSGAAQTALAGSAVYGMSKAALEMLTRTVAVEQAATTFQCISLRPGIFDTQMQAYMRSRDPAEFPSVDLFRGFKESGALKDPADVAARIVERFVLGPVENGRTYSHTDL